MIHIIWERWKTITYAQQTYKVSSLGRIKVNHKLIEPSINEHGYASVPTDYGYVYVHKLVAVAFLNKHQNDGLTIDHIDSNRRNNSVKNLELVSKEENLDRAKAKEINTSPHILAYHIEFNSLSKAFHYYCNTYKCKSKKQKLDFTHFKHEVLQAVTKNKKFAGTSWEFKGGAWLADEFINYLGYSVIPRYLEVYWHGV